MGSPKEERQFCLSQLRGPRYERVCGIHREKSCGSSG